MECLVDIVSDDEFSGLTSELKENILKTLLYLEKDKVSIDIALVSNEKMAKINEDSRDKKGPTTVLSFENNNFPQRKDNIQVLGEIYLAPNVIKEKGMNVFKVAIHGLLHLLGYTHKDQNDIIEMETLEDEIFEYLQLD
jgi:probable rRNA maturation factor